MTKLRSTIDVENKLDTREPLKVDSEKVDSSKPFFLSDEMKDGLADVLTGIEKMVGATGNKASMIWLVKPIMEFLIRKEFSLDKLNERLVMLENEGSEREINNFITYSLAQVDELKLYAAWVDSYADFYDALILESGLLETHPEYNLKTTEDMRRDLRNQSLSQASEKRKNLLATAKAMIK